MNINNWDWPQWLYFAMTLIGLLIMANKHKKPKEGRDNFFMAVLCTLPAWITEDSSNEHQRLYTIADRLLDGK